MPQRILLLIPALYGIEYKIKAELESIGFKVCLIENKELPFNYQGAKAKLRNIRWLFFQLFSSKERYLERELRKLPYQSFDILLSINCHIICPFLFKKLRSFNKDLRTILFLWDSSAMYEWHREITLFDRAYTFDPADAIKYGITFKPNFFLNVQPEKKENLYDLCFIGKYTPERFRLIEQVLSDLSTTSLRFFFRLLIMPPRYKFSGIICKVLKISGIKGTWTSDFLLSHDIYKKQIVRDYFMYESIDYDLAIEYIQKSNTILDIPFNSQKGMTHRTIQALSMGKKILTSAETGSIEFPSKNQVRNISSFCFVRDAAWISDKQCFKPDQSVRGNDLKNWLVTILNE